MASVTLPAGIVPVRSLTTDEILTGNRRSSLYIELLTRAEALIGTLSGVLGGSVDWAANSSIKGRGSLTVVDAGQSVDWLNARVRPVLTVAGLPPRSLGVFLFSEAPESWTGTGRSWPASLLDKSCILDRDKVAATYAVAAGTVVTDEVVSIIASTGETNIAITPSAATLTNSVIWDPGTPKLRIVNDLLDVINYFSLYCDENGQFRGEPYVRPAARPILWEFLDDDRSIYRPEFTRDADLLSIPNQITVISQGSGETPALTSTATNDDPTSPYSTVSRGQVIAADTETGVEIADQSTLDDYARRRLIELTSVTSSIPIEHAYVPGLAVNNTVRFRRLPAGIDGRHVISRTEISFEPTALVRSTLTEVVDL